MRPNYPNSHRRLGERELFLAYGSDYDEEEVTVHQTKRRRMQDREWTMGIDLSDGRDRSAFTLGYWENGVFHIAATGTFEGEGGFDLSPTGLRLKVNFSSPHIHAGGSES